LPVRFARLRIAGFKSFAEPATVEIRPGMTGIVGPNGCGKSNVVEALRWAMGESSARAMRGGEMDDVIFAGTAARASRNIAEVTLALEETKGVAPPPFHEHAELEISRRIERGGGSQYRVNGREARARDVQTLFADLASGARSSAMISQGRVGAIVNARPEERRSILEEAAGITGLHARRHEAELKLRAAEANLARAEDLRGQLETQLAALRRQARQASRYRNISGAVRLAEQELLALQRARATAAREAAQAALHAAEGAVAAATQAATAARATATESAAALPALRSEEAERRTALERHRIAREQLAEAEQRARAALDAASARRDQLRRDLAHARQLATDAAEAERRLAAEDGTLAEATDGHVARADAAESAAAAAREASRVAEAHANRATEAAAEASAAAQAAAQTLAQTRARAERASGVLARLTDEHDRAAAQRIPPERVAAAEAECAAAEAAQAGARAAQEQAEQARIAAQAALAQAREAQAAAASAHAKLCAEAQALAEVLAVKDGERWPPMVDALGVPPGLETALGAALGEELTSAADRAAARHWRELPPLDAPGGSVESATPLDRFVTAPPALARALSRILLVEDDSAGEAMQPLLPPGASAVSRAGGVWRWDGYTIRAGAPTAAAVRLRQRNRLGAVRAHLAESAAADAASRAARAEAEAGERAASAAEQQARAARRDAEARAERARAAVQQIRAQAGAAETRLAAIAGQHARAAAEHAEAAAQAAEAEAAQAGLADVAALRAAVEQARAALSAARVEETRLRAAHEALVREHAARVARRTAIAAERADWAARARDASGRVAELDTRAAEAEAEHAALAAAPAEAASRRAEAIDALEAAESAHRRAADTLAGALDAAERAERAARAADSALGAAREAAVRAEGEARQADHAWGTVAERIIERLGADAALPDPPADTGPESEERARRRLERLLKEREEMGPVNLRADIEAQEIETQIAAIVTERDELSTAIAKLRGSIGHLNREGRERLSQVFADVDRHFQALFARMFGGGRAHLAMVGSDDPLTAGLEIYAQPPGKKLATLSLLSGGEQALTALSLIFAVFRCNPAPVCVLDEVDAPLDDANVERFCNLLEDMVRETGTRFLVVTHHHLTMARMDRLYGVTMQERGVSRLLSVDLHAGQAMAEAPRIAAE
jgi:chromosome segregation protein